MPTFASPSDSTNLYYRTYTPSPGGPVQPVTLVFLHGWPMSSRMWEHLLLPLVETHRFRCVAPDRRGFGRSDWKTGKAGQIGWDVFVGDLVGLLKEIDVGDFVFVGSSMGCTESLLAYQGSDFIQEKCKVRPLLASIRFPLGLEDRQHVPRHGTNTEQGLVWLGPIMPYPLQAPHSPHSPSTDLWASILAGLRASRPVFVSESLPGIFAMQAGNDVHPKVLEHFERIVAEADGLAIERTVGVFNQEAGDEIRRLAEGDVPVLVVHGDSDQGMPMEESALVIKEMAPKVDLRIYEKAGHGAFFTPWGNVVKSVLTCV